MAENFEVLEGPRAYRETLLALIGAALAFGNVKQILKSIATVLEALPDPAHTLRGASEADLAARLAGFRHRYVTGVEMAALLAGAVSCATPPAATSPAPAPAAATPATRPARDPVDEKAAALEPSRTVVYKRVGDRALSLFVFEPEGFRRSDRRACFITIHGGGWTGMTPRRMSIMPEANRYFGAFVASPPNAWSTLV